MTKDKAPGNESPGGGIKERIREQLEGNRGACWGGGSDE